MKFVIFLLNFDEILSEFREELQKITKTVDISWKLRENAQNMPEISGIIIGENFIRHGSLFQSCP